MTTSIKVETMRDTASLIGRLARDGSGNVAIIFTLALIPLVGAAAAAVDYSKGSSIQTAMQSALDAAALNVVKDAGTLKHDEITATATKVFKANFNRPEATDVQIAANYNRGAATLTLNGSMAVPTSFMGLFGINEMSVAARSKAQAQIEGACMIALDPSATKSFQISGNGTLNIPNCGVYVNSSANVALQQMGSSWLRAKSTSVVGNYFGSHYTPLPKTAQPAAPDPACECSGANGPA